MSEAHYYTNIFKIHAITSFLCVFFSLLNTLFVLYIPTPIQYIEAEKCPTQRRNLGYVEVHTGKCPTPVCLYDKLAQN